MDSGCPVVSKRSVENRPVKCQVTACVTVCRLSSKNGVVTFYGLNLGDRPMSLLFDAQLSKYEKHVYWLLPHIQNHLTSK